MTAAPGTDRCRTTDEPPPNKGGRVADSGLAILCLLSYGVLPQDKTPAGTALATGLDWLTAKVQKSGDKRDSGRMYSQAIGTWALGEAFNLSQQAQYKQPMENAAEFLTFTRSSRSRKCDWYDPSS